MLEREAKRLPVTEAVRKTSTAGIGTTPFHARKGERMKSPIGLSTKVRQSKDQVSCSLNDEVAMLNLNTALYFGLDEVGALIWQALKEPIPAVELCKVVVDHFDVDETQCQEHVLEFLTRLEKAGLIEVIPSEPSV